MVDFAFEVGERVSKLLRFLSEFGFLFTFLSWFTFQGALVCMTWLCFLFARFSEFVGLQILFLFFGHGNVVTA